MKRLFLVKFYWQAVGVFKENKALRGVSVHANVLVCYALPVQLAYRRLNVVDFKGEVTQPGGLGAADPFGRVGEREQLDDVLAVEGQVGLIRVPLGSVVLGQHRKTQHLGIERKTPPIVRANYRNVVYLI